MDFDKSNPVKGSLITNDLELDDQAIHNNNHNKEADSCIEGLNDKGILSAFSICLITGIIIQLFSFDSHKNEFLIWFVFGNILILSGYSIFKKTYLLSNFKILFRICFIAKPSIQITNLGSRKRKEFLAIYMFSVFFVIFFRVQVFSSILVVLCFFGQVIGYFQYARTYNGMLDDFAKRFFGNIGNYEE